MNVVIFCARSSGWKGLWKISVSLRCMLDRMNDKRSACGKKNSTFLFLINFHILLTWSFHLVLDLQLSRLKDVMSQIYPKHANFY